MSLQSLEIRWKKALTSILEHLTESQFQKMLFNLDKIPQGVKSGKVREEIPQIIIQYYGPEGSISLIDKEMKLIPRMDAAVQGLLRPFVDKLKKQREKKKGATSKPAADPGPPRPPGPVAKRPKPAAGVSSKPAADPGPPRPPGPVAKRPKPAADGQKSCPPAQVAPVGSVKPKQKKTEKLKPTGSTKTSEGQRAAAQAVKIKTAGKKKGQ